MKQYVRNEMIPFYWTFLLNEFPIVLKNNKSELFLISLVVAACQSERRAEH